MFPEGRFDTHRANAKTPERHGATRKRAARRLRFGVEILEQRRLLAVNQWVGGSSGDFDVPSNWEGINNAPGIPGVNDQIELGGEMTIDVTGSASVNSIIGNQFQTFDVTGGTFTIENAGSANSSFGSLMLAPGAGLDVQEGALSVINGGSIAGPVGVSTGATLGFYGQNPVDFNAGASFSGGGDYDINGYFTSLVFNTSMSAPQNVTFEEGTIQVNDALTVPGTFKLSGGALTGAGTVDVAAGATMNISGSSSNLSELNTTVNNSGTVVWSGPERVAGSGVLNNLAGATVTMGNAGEFDPEVNNAGTLVKASSSGTGLVNFPAFLFNNSGTVDVDAGSIDLENDGTDTGVFNVAAGASLYFTSTNGTQNYTIAQGATWQGAGSLDIDGQFVDLLVNTDFTVPDLKLMDGAVDGTADLTITSTLDWTGGTMQGTGTTTIPSGATLEFAGAALRPSSTARWRTRGPQPGRAPRASAAAGSSTISPAARSASRMTNSSAPKSTTRAPWKRLAPQAPARAASLPSFSITRAPSTSTPARSRSTTTGPTPVSSTLPQDRRWSTSAPTAHRITRSARGRPGRAPAASSSTANLSTC